MKHANTIRSAAATVLTELADIATRAAKTLNSDAALPAIAVGKLIAAADKMSVSLRKHAHRLISK
jgi:hypothetical protein